ncbi:MAG: hypothetical protein AABZ53_00380 [Planctomycetota bacterium]
MQRRTARLAILCALLGGLTTVAVAWVLTLDLCVGMAPMRFAIAGSTWNGREIDVARRDALGEVALAAEPIGAAHMSVEQTVVLDDVVPSWARHELLGWTGGEEGAGPPEGAARAMLVTGWPFLSMWVSFDQQPSAGYWWYKARNGIRLAPAPANADFRALLSPRERVLPTRVAVGGFAMSTSFWAVVWAGLLLGPGAARRALRERRGRCTGCGYDRRGLEPGATCPECGASAGRVRRLEPREV